MIKQAKAEEAAVYIPSPAFLLYSAVDSVHVQWDFSQTDALRAVLHSTSVARLSTGTWYNRRLEYWSMSLVKM